MNLDTIGSVVVAPGAISIQQFFSSNIILSTGGNTGGVPEYLIPPASQLLQTFCGLNGAGNSVCKPGDVWVKRYLNQTGVSVNIIPTDGSGSGLFTINSQVKFVECYLLWITAEATINGVITSLTGSYQIIGNTVAAVAPVVEVKVEPPPVVIPDVKVAVPAPAAPVMISVSSPKVVSLLDNMMEEWTSLDLHNFRDEKDEKSRK